MMRHPLSVLAIWLGLWSLPASATVIFDGTGEDFFNDPLASFPTVAPSVDGSALEFLVAPEDEERVLATYPLASAGSFTTVDQWVVITIAANLTRPTEPFDSVFLVTDGDQIVGGQIVPSRRGSVRYITGHLHGDIADQFDGFFLDETGFVDVGQAFDVEFRIVLRSGGSDVGASFLGTSGITPTEALLDAASSLGFVLAADGLIIPPERYRINTLRLEIEQTDIPEPAVPLLLLSGVLLLAAHRSFGARPPYA